MPPFELRSSLEALMGISVLVSLTAHVILRTTSHQKGAGFSF